jgi:hypothetical protein
MNAYDDSDPGARLAALAGEVETLRQVVGDLGALPGQVRDLADVVAALADLTAPPRSVAVGLPSWLDLDGDFAGTVTVLGELVAWMATVYLRYTDAAGLPECWLWHPDVVEDLLWLHGAWLQAYRGNSASVAAAGDWHDRQRPGVTRRIKAVAGTCSLEAHQPGGDRHRGADPVPLADAIHLIGEWWSADRTSRAPTPDAGHIAAADALRAGRARR